MNFDRQQLTHDFRSDAYSRLSVLVEHVFVVLLEEGPRVVAAAQSVGVPAAVLQQTPVLQPSAMTAGTPIILAPRVPTPQLANVASLPNQAVIAAGGTATPSVVAAANAATATVPTSGLVYPYDAAYIQRMLEYSAAVESSAVGKCNSNYMHTIDNLY